MVSFLLGCISNKQPLNFWLFKKTTSLTEVMLLADFKTKISFGFSEVHEKAKRKKKVE